MIVIDFPFRGFVEKLFGLFEINISEGFFVKISIEKALKARLSS